MEYELGATMRPACVGRCCGTLLLILLPLSPAAGQSPIPPAPPAVYLQEGFTPPSLPSGWTVTVVSGTTAMWSIVGTGTNPPIPPYAPPGQAKFNSYDAAMGHQCRLTSRSVNLASAADPFLSFAMYHDDEFVGFPDSVYVEATTADSTAGPWVVLAGLLRIGSPPAWGREAVSLLQFAGAGRVFVSFRGVSNYGNNMYVDEVRIADSSFHDIGAQALLLQPNQAGRQSLGHGASSRVAVHTASGSKRSSPGAPLHLLIAGNSQPLLIGAVVRNFGTFPEASYQLRWAVDGQLQPPASNTGPLQRNTRDTLVLTWSSPSPGNHIVTAWTFLDGDSNRSNDTTRITAVVLDSNVVFHETFNGEVFPPPGWTAVNRDGGTLPPWFLGSPISMFVPYEGPGFAADNFQRANGTYIDDYLISPAVSGVGQAGRMDSLKFWVRSAFNPPPAANYPDSLMILLSTSGADTSNFTIALDYFSVPKQGWILKKYALHNRVPPNSAVRVAFRYLHYDGGFSGGNADFVGVDLVHFTRHLLTGVEPQAPLRESIALYRNFPNPFNAATHLGFGVAQCGLVSLKVYDLLGREVATLVNEVKQPGTYTVRFDGSGLASAVYVYRLENAGQVRTGRMILLK